MKKPLLKFDYSLIMILLAALIFLISFLVYSYKYPGIPVEEYLQEIPEEFIDETILMGDQCLYDADCPQPRCPGMSTVCENGYCITEQTEPVAARCIDLQTPICGNNICEGDEAITCPEDCE
ncbi:MAG: hypothetical protein Q8N77_06290 [Nanoarchaeota archaeon]|nr:hypothetical protein [Nanoarchaeota archaeon]